MALSTLSAFLTGKAAAATASVALAAGSGLAVAETVIPDQEASNLEVSSADEDPEDGEAGKDGKDIAAAQKSDADDESASSEAETTDGDDAGDGGRSSVVHAALVGDPTPTPADGAVFGAAVAERARDGGLGSSVAVVARGDNGPPATTGRSEDTGAPTDEARVDGQSRAAKARAQEDGTDADDETEGSAAAPADAKLPAVATERAQRAPSTD